MKWQEIADVPLNAWFRMKSEPSKIFRIADIDLNYCGAGPAMPGLALKAGPAVKIGVTWWRVTELANLFQYSFAVDGTYFMDCEDDWESEAGFDAIELGELRQANESLAATNRDNAARIEGLEKGLAALTSAVNILAQAKPEQAAPPAGDKPATDKPKKT